MCILLLLCATDEIIHDWRPGVRGEAPAAGLGGVYYTRCVVSDDDDDDSDNDNIINPVASYRLAAAVISYSTIYYNIAGVCMLQQ